MKQLTSFACGAFGALAVAFLIWVQSLGSYDPQGSSRVHELLLLKGYEADRITQPKALIFAGSNALFGMDSGIVSNAIDLPVVNMATHAGFPLRFLTYFLLPHIKRGDVVIAPLEFEYYIRDGSTSDLEISAVEAWAPDYAFASLQNTIKYFRNTSFLRVARDILSPVPTPDAPTIEKMAEVADANTKRGISRWEGYSAASLNSYGDMLIDQPNMFKQERNYLSEVPNQAALDEVVWLKKQIESKGATLLLIWPVSGRNPLFDARSERGKQAAEIWRKMLADAGLEIHCRIEDFSFDQSLLFDTRYHMGLEGGLRRSEAIAACLSEREPTTDIEAAISERRRKASEYDAAHP